MERNTQYAARIIDIFEEVLKEKNIMIPDKWRNGNDDESCIYGETYYKIEYAISAFLDRITEEKIEFLDTKDVATALGCSLPAARNIMNRADFPLIRVGKNYKVSKDALIEWTKKRRI
ncbi:MAG: helix-turn-helix domain-containing protein [Ruminococcus sp.]|nr:helix-turn-helix domain-containing protein [Ruminococcus sp.]